LHFEVNVWNIGFFLTLHPVQLKNRVQFFGSGISEKFGRGWRAQRARCCLAARNRRSLGKP
jgi:hypothetical protein